MADQERDGVAGIERQDAGAGAAAADQGGGLALEGRAPPPGVPVPHAIEVTWEGGTRFRGGPEGGPTVLLDGAREAGPSPVDSLVVALAACSAIDVARILEKRRTPASALSVRVRFSRAPQPPRRLTELHLEWRVATTSERQHIERAIELSMSTYCSVSASLAPDTRLTWSIVDDR
jgi:putative redox protein